MENLTATSLRTLPSMFMLAILVCFASLITCVVVWPSIDLIVSGWFYEPGKGFFLAEQPFFVFLHWLAYYGARALGLSLLLAVIFTLLRHQPLWGIRTKGWVFLLLGLLIAPGLVGNVAFKNHWGRARPREVTEFGGQAHFSPALVPQSLAHNNGSFVSGDASFGFYLPSIAYVVPYRASRRFFWSGMAVAGLFALARLVMGAHFLSDTLFAALLMLITTALLHASIFGRKATRQYWRNWLSGSAEES